MFSLWKKIMKTQKSKQKKVTQCHPGLSDPPFTYISLYILLQLETLKKVLCGQHFDHISHSNSRGFTSGIACTLHFDVTRCAKPKSEKIQ